MADTTSTPLYRLLEEKLGGSLADYVARKRTAGMSWRAMASDLSATTGVEVSNEALRLWFSHRIQVRVEVAA
jgi:hypothetical protein